MIKPVKRNKRLKWIDSHYADFYKQELFLWKVKAVQIAAAGCAKSLAIAGNSMAHYAMAINLATAAKAITEIPRAKGRVTK